MLLISDDEDFDQRFTCSIIENTLLKKCNGIYCKQIKLQIVAFQCIGLKKVINNWYIMQEFMPLPPDESNGDASSAEEPKLQFSYVECLMYAFHQLAKHKEDFFSADEGAAARLKDFRIRLGLY